MIDYRIYDPDGDGHKKLDHVADMLNDVVLKKKIPAAKVFMDSWYAAQKLMALIDNLGKIYYVLLKKIGWLMIPEVKKNISLLNS